MRNLAHRAVFLLLALPLLMGFAFPGSVQRLWRQADRAFNRKQYQQAAELYDKARVEHPQEWRLLYNTAVAQAFNKQYDPAVQSFQKLAANGLQELREPSEYNTGNCYLAQQKTGKAIEHYKRALYLKPDDMNAKWNLELAKRKQQEQKQQQKQQKKEQQQKPKPDKQKEQQKQQQQQPKQMDKEQAQRLLQSLSQADRDLQKKLSKQRNQPTRESRPSKDW